MRISSRALESIVAHAREERPRECCGILIGTSVQIVDSIRTLNLAESPTRFVIDPRGHFDAIREARARALEVIGFYHSHPHSEPVPSPTDLAEATDVDSLHLIVSLAHDLPSSGLFRLAESGYMEVPLHVSGEED